MHERIARLAELGQSLWFDYIRRGMFTSGQMQELLDNGITGMTSNPSIFEKAINESSDYDDALKALAASGKPDQQAYEALAIEDIRTAADALRPVHDRTGGADGYVSLEVNPHLADDTAGTIEEARRLWATVNRPNLMIKVPATPAGMPAIRALLAEGININVTLIFSCQAYRQVADAYLAALEDRASAGRELGSVASVASFFVSRLDTLVDQHLAARIDSGNTDLEPLLGRAAVANAKVVYAAFREIFDGPRFATLAPRGARIQRLLWGSTSTKNPAYSDTLYVDTLIGPDTVNTVPPAALEAFMDHGIPARTADAELQDARQVLGQLESAGLPLDELTHQLLLDGVGAFASSFDKLMTSLRNRTAAA